MPTADKNKAALQGLIAKANAATGASDADLTSAVSTLIGGYGSGGSSGTPSGGVYIARITPAEDMASFTIKHNLGTRDILLAAVWAEGLGDNNPAVNTTIAKFWARSSVPTYRAGNGLSPGYNWLSGSTYASVIGPNTAAYETLTVTDENTVVLPRVTSGTVAYYLAGLTYTVLVVAA